jgi:hypothetical protein
MNWQELIMKISKDNSLFNFFILIIFLIILVILAIFKIILDIIKERKRDVKKIEISPRVIKFEFDKRLPDIPEGYYVDKTKIVELEKELQEAENLLNEIENKYKKENNELIKIIKTYEELTDDLFRKIRSLLEQNQSLYIISKGWFFNFLDLFLDDYEKKLLLLLFKENSLNKEQFIEKVKLNFNVSIQEFQIENMLKILQELKLISMKNDKLYELTNLGIEFLEFKNLIKQNAQNN